MLGEVASLTFFLKESKINKELTHLKTKDLKNKHHKRNNYFCI